MGSEGGELGLMADFSEHDIQLSGSLKVGNFFSHVIIKNSKNLISFISYIVVKFTVSIKKRSY
jgi:hypothetical protein